ncbi:hypothetical protein HGB25_01330 [Candidatus Saccharibacteria bacterium]|nr:hypothetical protein [Candidatus Saccharibacteria bacterium]
MREISGRSRLYNVLPGELTGGDIESAQTFLDSKSPSDLKFWASQRSREPYSCGDQRFRMVVDKPNGGNRDKAVLFLSEFGTPDLPRLIAKARITRDFIDPEASLVIQPSSVNGEDNMNFSHDERLRLLKGDLQPYIARIAIVMKSLSDPEDLTIFGPSQGATVGMAYASSDEVHATALTIVEAPNVAERNSLSLAQDFAQSGQDLARVVRANFDNHERPLAQLIEKDASSPVSMARFIVSAMHPDNMATVGVMQHNTASEHIKAVLDKGGSVVHAWGDVDNVSPAFNNQRIADEFEAQPRYASRVLRNMGHTAMDFYALDGALARLAHNLHTTPIDVG